MGKVEKIHNYYSLYLAQNSKKEYRPNIDILLHIYDNFFVCNINSERNSFKLDLSLNFKKTRLLRLSIAAR